MSAAAIADPRWAPEPRLAPAPVIRIVSFAGLALFAGLRWATLEAPTAAGRMTLAAALAVGLTVGTHASSRLARGPALAARAAMLALGLALLLLLAGVPLRLLAPAHWADLLSGLSQGVQSLPGIGVPYSGVDPWVRIVLLAGGAVLLALGGLLAARALRRDRRAVGAALVLAAAYTTAIVEHPPAHPYLGGVALTLLAGGLLWGDRIERAHAVPAAAFVALALGGAVLAAPQLDASKPWIDYQAIVESLSTPPSITYAWNHSYGPLHWPRDNREMLRISARAPVYWKAVDLDTFDGVDWRASQLLPPRLDSEIAPGHRSWHETLRVTVRDLRSPAYVGAGSALRVRRSPRYAIPAAPGTFATGRAPLRRGDSYLMDVYAPRPSALELARAGSDYPSFAAGFLTMDLPQSVGGPVFRAPLGTPAALGADHVVFQQFGLLSGPVLIDPLGRLHRNGDAILRRSAYGPMYALARKLRGETDTPYQYIRAVESRLASGYAYTENPARPRPGRPPLVSFVFDSRAGYCQQFSGAMALLLRMGGIPARVASGFTPGVYDAPRREWVVHDVDAHSWVEAYIPRIGWVPFDPTPSVAPPHHQLTAVSGPPSVRPSPLRRDPRRADVPAKGRLRRAAVPDSSVAPLWLVALVVLFVTFALAAAIGMLRARRRRPLVPAPPELAELDRALRLTGRPAEPGITLRALEERYRRHAPAAAAYIASVRLRRFAGRTDPPTAEQRRALRRELAEGLGWGGRLRAWWALPPAWARAHRVLE